MYKLIFLEIFIYHLSSNMTSHPQEWLSRELKPVYKEHSRLKKTVALENFFFQLKFPTSLTKFEKLKSIGETLIQIRKGLKIHSNKCSENTSLNLAKRTCYNISYLGGTDAECRATSPLMVEDSLKQNH